MDRIFSISSDTEARTFVRFVHTLILFILVRVADAPPKGV